MTSIILISGAPASGKTSISKKIAKALNLPLISKDEYKELLFDTIGIKDDDWSKALGAASYELFFVSIERLLRSNNSMIIEAPMSPERHNKVFKELKKKYDFQIFEINCHCKGEVLFKRFKERYESGKRHPGHQDHLRYDKMEKQLLNSSHNPLLICDDGILLDTVDIENIDMVAILHKINNFLSKAGSS